MARSAHYEGGLNTISSSRSGTATFIVGALPKKGRIVRVRFHSGDVPGVGATADVVVWSADGAVSTSLTGVVDLAAALSTAAVARQGFEAALIAPQAALSVADGQLVEVIQASVTSQLLVEVAFEPR